MAINVSMANQQADSLRSYEAYLTQAKNSLREYRSNLNSNWQGKELTYINHAIDRMLLQLSDTQNQLLPLSQEIKLVAEQIRREEEKAKQINLVTIALNAAVVAANEIKNRLDDMIKAFEDELKKHPQRKIIDSVNSQVEIIRREYEEALKKIDELQNKLKELSQ